MKFPITKQDIDGGIQEDCYECPLALSINRTIGDKFSFHEIDVSVDRVSVDIFIKRTGNHESLWEYHNAGLSREAKEFIWQFDNNVPVSPCTIDIDINLE